MAIPNLAAAQALVQSYEQATRIVYCINALLNDGPTIVLKYQINGEPFELTVPSEAVVFVWRDQLNAVNAEIIARGGDPVAQPPAPQPVQPSP